MTDQSRIPFPKTPEQGARRDSLIERATGQFDLNSFIAPPIPGELIPPPRKLPARSMPPRQAEAVSEAPVAPQPVHEPEAVQQAAPAAVPAPPVAAPAVPV